MRVLNLIQRWLWRIPDILWDPLAAGFMLIAIGLLGVFTAEPLLFPSLGPSAFLQIEDPQLRVSRIYNTIVGHLIGLGSGVLAVFVLGAAQAPSAITHGHLVMVRVFASALAIALTIVIGLLLHASHPPAAATTLLVALGGFRLTLSTMLIVVAGVLLTGFLGEGLRRLRVRKRALVSS